MRPATGGSRTCAVLPFAIAFAAVLLAYLPALFGGFVWDDDSHVTGAMALRTAEGLRDIWLKPGATCQYYPLTFTAFWLQYHLWALHPFGYHAVNILLHAANALLLRHLLHRMRAPGAWWAAGLFALHPVYVMSVAWITELKNVLSTAFALGSALLLLRHWEEQERGTARRPVLLLGAAWTLFACALLSKTAALVLPVGVGALLWWRTGRLGRRQAVTLALMLAAGIAAGLATLWIERTLVGARGEEFHLSLPERIIVAGRSFWFYLGKLFWPARLSFIYPTWEVHAADWRSYLFPASALALLAAAWLSRGRIGRGPFAALAHFALASPVLVLFQVIFMMRYTYVSDHWQYVSSIGVVALVAGAAETVGRRFDSGGRRIAGAGAAALLAVLGALTWRQATIYRNIETLWRDTLAKNPQCWMAHNNLGLVLVDRGDLAGAIHHHREAIRIKPDHAKARANLGVALVKAGRSAEAAAQYTRALELDPSCAEALANWGMLLVKQGKTEEGLSRVEQAMRIRPGFDEAVNGMGLVLAGQGKEEEAIRQFERALAINPRNVNALNNVGALLVRRERLEEGAERYRAALQLQPDNASIHHNLGHVLSLLQRYDEAVARFREAIRIRPRFPEACNGLGAALLKQKRVAEAVSAFRAGLQSAPDNALLHGNLGGALLMQGDLAGAEKHLSAALRVNPDDPNARNNLKALDEARRRTSAKPAVPAEAVLP
jgi:Flp pilus assembly protein TadD